LALGFVGDVGDLIKLVMAQNGRRNIPDSESKLAHELADCLWSIIVLANAHGIDLENTFLKTMDDIEGYIQKSSCRLEMKLSVATASLYFKPFEQVLDIIVEAGFHNIELDMFWMRNELAMAQHLRDIPVPRVIRAVEMAGLKISSIHDGGGSLADEVAMEGYINPSLDEYLSAMGYAPACLVFHPPHIKGNPGDGWWERTMGEMVQALEKYRKACKFVTIENMPFFDDYFVPLTTPEELGAFTTENKLGVTLDTTHYALMGTDICEAARILKRNIKTIHLSDFKAGQGHVFIGEGTLDLPGFLDIIDRENLATLTLECSLASKDNPNQEISPEDMVNRLRDARIRVESFVCGISRNE